MKTLFPVATWRRGQTAAAVAALLAALALELAPELRAASEFTPHQWSIPGGIARIAPGICSGSDRIIVESRSGSRFAIVVTPGGLAPREISDCAPIAPATRPGLLPDGKLVRGERNIREAWLAAPTTRYGHGILGDSVEAGALRVLTAEGRELEFTLDQGSVFEDLTPRLVKLESNGNDQVLLVRSRLDKGSSVAVFTVAEGKLVLWAESRPIGRSHRWLNPVGVADFDGDGRREVAVVLTPHIGGNLSLYRREGTRLVAAYRKYGFSNHAIGSRELGMSAVVDANGDGVPDIALPGVSRRTLRVVTFAGGRFAELYRFPHGREIVTAILAADLDGSGNADLLYGLADGTLVALVR